MPSVRREERAFHFHLIAYRNSRSVNLTRIPEMRKRQLRIHFRSPPTVGVSGGERDRYRQRPFALRLRTGDFSFCTHSATGQGRCCAGGGDGPGMNFSCSFAVNKYILCALAESRRSIPSASPSEPLPQLGADPNRSPPHYSI